MKIAATLIILAVLAAGCGGGSSGGTITVTAGSSSPTSQAPATVDEAQALADYLAIVKPVKADINEHADAMQSALTKVSDTGGTDNGALDDAASEIADGVAAYQEDL